MSRVLSGTKIKLGRLLALILAFVLLATATGTGDGAGPKWTIIGPGGGGSMFFPTVSPHDPSVALIACDMTGAYITTNAGRSWRTQKRPRESRNPSSFARLPGAKS